MFLGATSSFLKVVDFGVKQYVYEKIELTQ